ncbi:MAG: NAD(P)/FAD-dependent oxidoreductase [Hydrococcus sp. Prado102]|jgi:pyruvate/2-oxoglutarate dehydrogenase complex dihydrolipoamide dehydrogenase (E3) component|nr:NAD(P)/FAD-dependent oxidoreductase [Hydrococcus sp. Prado102]
MSVEYDLVVIGASEEGIYAAVAAASRKARVALVEQPPKGCGGDFEVIFNRTLSHVTHLSEQLDIAMQLGAYQPTPHLEIQLTQAQAWAQEARAILAEQNSLATLAALGIDVIRGSGEFCRLPRQAFIIGNRKLRSRSYLLATGSHLVPMAIEGIERVGYLTPSELYQKDVLTSLSQELTIIGSSPLAIQLAQNLRQTGKSIVLLIEDKRLLSTEDLEVAKLIQAQLEASGVEILVDSRVTQVQQIEEKKWLQAGNRALETDEIILVGNQQPNIEGLNLEGVGVKISDRGIELNEKLQTTNPNIYACGYSLNHLARYEASIAVENALCFPFFKVDYRTIPYVMFTNPPIARVGITEAEARTKFGKNVWVFKQEFKSLAIAQLSGETTGFCKLIVRSNGEILGAHIIGSQAGEYIGTIALAIKNKIKLKSFIDSFSAFTFSVILQAIALEWRHQRLRKNKILQRLLNCLTYYIDKTI